MSLVLLREAADAFATSGGRTLTPEIVAATLLWLLAWRRSDSPWQPPTRFFDGSTQPTLPHDSLRALATPRQHPRSVDVIAALTTGISAAAKQWTLGNPEEPDAREVLRMAFDVLWSRRLIPRPPSKTYPRGV